jgi:hypothetical protein
LVIPSVQYFNATTAQIGMVGVLTDVRFVVPAATAFAATGMGHFNQSLLVVLAGQEFCPWFSADLELRNQQPIT